MSVEVGGYKRTLMHNTQNKLLLAPGVIWMALFLVVPLGMMVYVSFWTQTTFAISSDLTLKSWKTFFASETYFQCFETYFQCFETCFQSFKTSSEKSTGKHSFESHR